MEEYQLTVVDTRVYFVGGLDKFSVDHLTREFHKLEDIKTNNTNKLIKFYITSGGGTSISGLELYDLLTNINLDLSIYLKGKVGSAASLTAFTKHKTLMYKNAFLAFHELTNSHEEKYSNAKADIDCATKLMNKYISIYNTKVSEINYEWLVVDKYLTSQEALEMKIVDEVV